MIRKLSSKGRILAAFLLAAACLGGIMLFQIRAADNSDYSFYNLASSAASYYDAARKPSADSDDFLEGDANAGNAGGLVGYVDKNITPGASTSLRSDSSNNAQTVSIPSSLNRNSAALLDEGVLGYMYYGQALEYFGLDTVGKQSGILSFLYQTIASLTFIFYYLSSAMQMLFGMVLSFLKLLNPFRFLGFLGQSSVEVPDMSQAIWDSSTQKWIASSHAAFWDTSIGSAGDHGWIGDLTTMISGWYTALSEMSWQIAIPLFTVLLFASFVFYERTDHFKSSLKKYGIRIFFLVAGIPILGSLYTGILNSVTYSMGMTNGSQAAAYQIATTYVDFETWCKTSNLNLPYGAQIAVTNDENQSPSFTLKNMSLANVAWSASNMKSPFVEYEDQDWNSMGSGMYEADVHHVTSILSRYIMSNTFSAADYESWFKTSIAGNNPDLYDEIETYSDPFELERDGQSGGRAFTDRSSDPAGILTNGSLTASFTGNGQSQTLTLQRGDSSGYGLSTLAMYNFLNTDFTSAGATVYSSRNTSNNRISMARNSVTVAGRSGPERLVNALKTLLMIAAFVVVQFLFIFQLVVRNTITGFRMICSTPGALLGSIHSIGTVIAYVVIMIVQILAAAFIMEMSGILMSMISRIDLLSFMQTPASFGFITLNQTMPASNLMNTAGQAVGALVSGILSCLIYLAFIVFITRFSVSITTGISTGIIKLVDQLLSVPAPHNFSLASEALGSVESSVQSVQSVPSTIKTMSGQTLSRRTEKLSKNSSPDSGNPNVSRNGPDDNNGGGGNNGGGTSFISSAVSSAAQTGTSVSQNGTKAASETAGMSAGQSEAGRTGNSSAYAGSSLSAAGQPSSLRSETGADGQPQSSLKPDMAQAISTQAGQSVNSSSASGMASGYVQAAGQEHMNGQNFVSGNPAVRNGSNGSGTSAASVNSPNATSSAPVGSPGFSAMNTQVDRQPGSVQSPYGGQSAMKTASDAGFMAASMKERTGRSEQASSGSNAALNPSANQASSQMQSSNLSLNSRPDKTGGHSGHQNDGSMQTASGFGPAKTGYGYTNKTSDLETGRTAVSHGGFQSRSAFGAQFVNRASSLNQASAMNSASASGSQSSGQMQNGSSHSRPDAANSSGHTSPKHGGSSGRMNGSQNGSAKSNGTSQSHENASSKTTRQHPANGTSNMFAGSSSPKFAFFMSSMPSGSAKAKAGGIQNGQAQKAASEGRQRHSHGGSVSMPSNGFNTQGYRRPSSSGIHNSAGTAGPFGSGTAGQTSKNSFASGNSSGSRRHGGQKTESRTFSPGTDSSFYTHALRPVSGNEGSQSARNRRDGRPADLQSSRSLAAKPVGENLNRESSRSSASLNRPGSSIQNGARHMSVNFDDYGMDENKRNDGGNSGRMI